MQDQQLIRQLLTELLAEKSPELGARLKQRLSAACISRGLGPFSEREFGHSKFSEFLHAVLGNGISIGRPSGAGDILIALAAARPLPAVASNHAPGPRVRNDVWQAFSNPDVRRKRYVNIHTRQVLHFLQGDGSAAEKLVAESPTSYLEITPVSAATHGQWMREYVASLNVRPEESAALVALAALPYSSQLNLTFTKALAEHAAGWRVMRVKKVVEAVSAWASQNHVPVATLLEPTTSSSAEPATPAAAAIGVAESVRDNARRMLDLLSEDDLKHVVMPVIYATLLVRSRP